MGPDPAPSWTVPQDPQSPVTVVSERLGLLQRQLLRANGLTNLERQLLLGTLAVARLDLEHLARQLDGQTRDQNQSPGGNGSGWPRA
jgi:hypothetical protein